ncbi:Bursicon [Eumeta japonica]|uniref:Bursicon n=1 Tax=Eumeta variegata TaxID=151549 RepID=A0A4C1ZP61_EUMVA|nr:Bursicon [Eumeta japonica]
MAKNQVEENTGEVTKCFFPRTDKTYKVLRQIEMTAQMARNTASLHTTCIGSLGKKKPAKCESDSRTEGSVQTYKNTAGRCYDARTPGAREKKTILGHGEGRSGLQGELVSGAKIWQIERSCNCCQESVETETSVTLECPDAAPGESKYKTESTKENIQIASSILELAAKFEDEAHRLLVEAYNEATLNERTCREWFQNLKTVILTKKTKIAVEDQKFMRRQNWKNCWRKIRIV